MAVNEIRYKGVSYATDDDIKVPSGILYEVKALRSDSLEANSLTVTVFSNNKAIMGFAKNDKVEYFRDGRRVGVYYLQTVERVGSDAYTLSALSALGRLITMRHAGGIYTGQTVAEVVPQICGPVAVMIESVYASRKLYGYLPYSNPDTKTGNGRSARDNLSQVLFAIGASLGVDENGVMRVEKLWDGVSATITADQINEDSCSTVYETPVSAVEITEHQWVKSGAAVSLFDGTAEEGTLVTFSDPAYDLVGSGVTVRESGANYAILSAGTGTLTGKSYNHLTRIVRRTVTDGVEENVVTVSDATLVSLTNSVDVAKRMADYYRHRETIRVDVEPGTERAGRVVQIFHPWDKEMVQACVESRETVISGILNSQTSALVGFTPAQPEQAEYFSERVLLTGSGTWTPPEGAEAVTAVLIGDGQDGTAGQNGEGVVLTGQTIPNTCSGSFPSASAGKGGKAGSPGSGGKIFQITMDITPGMSFSYVTSQNGEAVFGSHSSAEGSASPNGYYDDVTGKTYARQGAVGYDGGDGGAPGKSGRSVAGYKGGYGSQAGEYTKRMTENNIRYTQTFKHQGIGGPGAAMGTAVTWGPSVFSVALPTFIPNIRITGSAPGASAVPGADGENYGDGGGAGHGGGGAGGIGSCSISMSPTPPSTQHQVLNFSGDLQHGGSGSSGGKGKPGCIILFYGKKKTIKSGPLVQRGGGLFFDRLNKLFIV
nr:MAG TPA: hypothetical protein [Caudoviricetes sp.]